MLDGKAEGGLSSGKQIGLFSPDPREESVRVTLYGLGCLLSIRVVSRARRCPQPISGKRRSDQEQRTIGRASMNRKGSEELDTLLSHPEALPDPFRLRVWLAV